ncbi:MAG: hypothetical protein PHY23_05080 [Oscillospiraceae bacterium]|jgi:hypothetical protein|nr:hypothetical protein [Oscillospiraceae bacterium]
MKDTIRAGMTQAFVNEDIFKAFAGQVGLSAIGFGLQFKSWILFGVLFLAPIFVFMFATKHKILRIISLVFAGVYTVGWAVGGYLIGSLFSLSASIVLAIIGLLCGAGCNRGAIVYFKDIE